MDIGELLSYKPPNTPKRSQESESENDIPKKHRKISRPERTKRPLLIDPEENPPTSDNVNFPIHKKEISNENVLRLVEKENESEEPFDESAIKKMILLFEKRTLKNQEMRIKFPENPEKFLESEMELHDIIQELNVITTMPEMYSILIGLNAVPSLLELLSHENSDVSVAVVGLIQELSDAHDQGDHSKVLMNALIDHQICALLVQNLDRLDEQVKEDSDGVFNTLSFFENLFEMRPDVCLDAAKQGLLQWLLRRLRAKLPFSENKLYSTEVLSILLQNTPENRQMLGDLEGIDILLQQLAFYKKHDPHTPEELEMMENLFSILCSSLSYSPNRERFLHGEGLQLMNLMLREKKQSRNGSLKVLNHAITGPDGKENCNKFVDILGLRTIFPLFMKTPKKNKKRLLTNEEFEEHVCSIIANMLRNCRGQQRQRLLNKFVENDFEKVDRLMELHFKYLDKVEEIDNQIEQEMRQLGEHDYDEDDADERYLRRLSGGLFTLQHIDYILMQVCTGAPAAAKQRAVKTLSLRGGSLNTVRQLMREYAGNLGTDGDHPEWTAAEQQHILQMIDKF